jgi:hypothetical protein
MAASVDALRVALLQSPYVRHRMMGRMLETHNHHVVRVVIDAALLCSPPVEEYTRHLAEQIAHPGQGQGHQGWAMTPPPLRRVLFSTAASADGGSGSGGSGTDGYGGTAGSDGSGGTDGSGGAGDSGGSDGSGGTDGSGGSGDSGGSDGSGGPGGACVLFAPRVVKGMYIRYRFSPPYGWMRGVVQHRHRPHAGDNFFVVRWQDGTRDAVQITAGNHLDVWAECVISV